MNPTSLSGTTFCMVRDEYALSSQLSKLTLVVGCLAGLGFMFLGIILYQLVCFKVGIDTLPFKLSILSLLYFREKKSPIRSIWK